VDADPPSEKPRGFGFIRFPTTDEATAFLDRVYPHIRLESKSTSNGERESCQVRVAFSRERDERNRGEPAEGDWTCKLVRSANTNGNEVC